MHDIAIATDANRIVATSHINVMHHITIGMDHISDRAHHVANAIGDHSSVSRRITTVCPA